MNAICPGFIDSHVHLSETLARAVFPDNLNTRAGVFHWAKPFYAHITEEDEYCGALLGITEMLRAGTTCFLDMGCNMTPRSSSAPWRKPAIRGVTGRHAADNPPAEIPRGWTDEMMHHHFFPSTEAALKELEFCVRKYNGALDGRVRCWVNIEGKEPCTLALHVGARSLAERLGVGATYHLATSIEEAKVCETKYGCWPLTRIDKAGGFGSNLVIAHCVAVENNQVCAARTTRRQGGILPLLVFQARQRRDGDRQVSRNGGGRSDRRSRYRWSCGRRQSQPYAADAFGRRDV